VTFSFLEPVPGNSLTDHSQIKYFPVRNDVILNKYVTFRAIDRKIIILY
jgi:hypothetical protein